MLSLLTLHARELEESIRLTDSLTHPDPLESRQRNVARKVGFGRRRTSGARCTGGGGGGALEEAAAAGRIRITTPARVLLPAVVVHVEQQRYDIDDVDVKKHHHHHEVRAGAHAALRAGEAIARRRELDLPVPAGRSQVRCVRGLLGVRHFVQG